MALAFLKVVEDADARLEDDEIKLGEPDTSEAESLPLHVDKCAKRYRVTIRRLNKLDRLMGRALMLLVIVLGWQVLTSPQFATALKMLAP